MESRSKESASIGDKEDLPVLMVGLWLRVVIYVMFFLSGATALVFEILWSRQFVTILGNSSYAISVVLCAFMAGIGIGALLGGRVADRFPRRLLVYAIIQAGVALWAMGIPVLLDGMRVWLPGLSLLAPQSLLVPSLTRFVVSFGVLLVPCMMMGATLPLLSRFCADSAAVIGGRIGILYGLNTLGGAAGCFAAGFWMIDTLGLSASNQLAVATNLSMAALVVLQHVIRHRGLGASAARRPEPATPGGRIPGTEREPARGKTGLLLTVAFITGAAGLSCEILWMRYLSFFSNLAYVFPTILGIYLLGLGIGSLAYRLLFARHVRPVSVLSWTMILLGWAVPSFFAANVLILCLREPGSTGLLPLAAIILVVPTLLMGMTLPLVCAAFTGKITRVGRNVGIVYAINTAGSIVGSLIPVFVLIPTLGIQHSILLMALLYAGAGVTLLVVTARRRRSVRLAWSAACIAAMVAVFAVIVPGDLCERAFLSVSWKLSRHNDIIFYREGMTGTASVVRDKLNGFKMIYINGTAEVPTTYADMTTFKLMGGLGPLLHPDPEKVLMICFGGGVAAGAAIQYPAVKSLEVVDLESSVVEAARLFEEENNSLLSNPKVRVTIDDGRNYILVSRRKWPVIVCDSTHPKSSDSWVLYTREFYELCKAHLTGDGVFVQWVGTGLSIADYKIILRTFQSVFPHASLWIPHGINETGIHSGYTLLVATPRKLAVDVESLRRKLSIPAVTADLQPWGLDDPVGILETFVTGEEALRQWIGDGPINTDDLPYTQYDTRYSGGPQSGLSALAPLMESVWPYLYNTGGEHESRDLEHELALHRNANRRMFVGRLSQAYALLPDDGKVRKYRENHALGSSYIRRAADFYPDCPGVLTMWALLAKKQSGGREIAATLLRRALELDPDSLAAHHNLGLILSTMDNVDEATVHFLRAVEIDPDSADAHLNLGYARMMQHRPEEAIARWRRAVAIKPDLARAHANLGGALAQQGNVPEAMAHFEQALRLDPYSAMAHTNMATFLAGIGRFDRAIGQFSEALRIDPDREDARRGLARALKLKTNQNTQPQAGNPRSPSRPAAQYN